MVDRCDVCGRVKAMAFTALDQNLCRRNFLFPGERADAAGFGRRDCESKRVDWRARALAAEARTRNSVACLRNALIDATAILRSRGLAGDQKCMRAAQRADLEIGVFADLTGGSDGR